MEALAIHIQVSLKCFKYTKNGLKVSSALNYDRPCLVLNLTETRIDRFLVVECCVTGLYKNFSSSMHCISSLVFVVTIFENGEPASISKIATTKANQEIAHARLSRLLTSGYLNVIWSIIIEVRKRCTLSASCLTYTYFFYQ